MTSGFNKFLETGGEGAKGLTDGTEALFSSTISAANLKNSLPLRTDASRIVFSTKLDIADTLLLQAALDSKVANPLTSNIDAAQFEIFDLNNIKIDTTGSGTDIATVEYNGTGNITFDLDDIGDVASASNFTVDDRLITTDTVSGVKNIQQSAITVDDSGNMSGIGDLTASSKIDFNTCEELDVNATLNFANVVSLRATGGTVATMRTLNTTGTASDSISITSTAGGIELSSFSDINVVGGGLNVAGNPVLVSDTTPVVTDTIPRYFGTGGSLVRTTGLVVDDSDNITGISGLEADGNIDFDSCVNFRVSATQNLPSAIDLKTVGGSIASIVIENSSGTGVGSVTLQSTSGGVEFISDLGTKVQSGGLIVTETATEDDTSAVQIDVDAAGFADVHGIDITYETGGINAGDVEVGNLVNIDQSASLGGRVLGSVVVSTSGSATVDALGAGTGVNPILQQSGTFSDADSILVNAVDELADLSGGGAGNVSVFVADNDILVIGLSTKFAEIEFIVDTGASGSGVAPTFEYSIGVGTWAFFSPTDGTRGFRNSGNVLWDIADIPGWLVGLASEFLIRTTRTRNTLSTTPILDLVNVANTVEYSWDKDGIITAASVDITGQLTTSSNVLIDTVDSSTNTFYGFSTSASGIGNTLVGSLAGGSGNLTNNNLCIGISAGENATGSSQICVGTQAGKNSGSGTNCCYVGGLSGTGCTGIDNCCFGTGTMLNATTADDNVALGTGCLDNLLTGDLNVALGNDAANSYTGSESNNIVIQNTGVIGDSGMIRIGTSGTHTSAIFPSEILLEDNSNTVGWSVSTIQASSYSVELPFNAPVSDQNTVMTNKNNFASWSVNAPHPRGYIFDGRLGFLTDSTVSVAPVDCRNDTNVQNFSRTSATVNMATSGVLGIQTSDAPIAADTWYEINVIGDTSDSNSDTFIAIEAGSSLTQTGYDIKRKLGYVRSNSTSDIIDFTMHHLGNYRRVVYNDTSVNLQLLTPSGPAAGTTLETLDCSDLLPPGCTQFDMHIELDQDDDGDQFRFQNPDSGEVYANCVHRVGTGINTAPGAELNLTISNIGVNSSQELEWGCTAIGNVVDLVCVSYVQDL